jgi:biopolymer transport protein ExbB
MSSRWHASLRSQALVALSLVLLGMGWSGLPQAAWSQEADAPEAAAAAGEGRDMGAKPAATEERKNAFMVYVKAAGLIGAFIVLLSMYFVATTIQLFLEFRPQNSAPPELLSECESRLEARQFKEVFAAVDGDGSFYGRTVATGIRELPNGLAEARDAMERVGESITVDMERKITILAVLGTLGPMIGLLGTLKGMIASFHEIAVGGTQLKADKVAEGISEALILTLLGVGLSVPAIYFYSVFKNRVTSISVNTMLQADEFLRRFAHLARSKTAGPAAAAPAKPAKP